MHYATEVFAATFFFNANLEVVLCPIGNLQLVLTTGLGKG